MRRIPYRTWPAFFRREWVYRAGIRDVLLAADVEDLLSDWRRGVRIPRSYRHHLPQPHIDQWWRIARGIERATRRECK